MRGRRITRERGKKSAWGLSRTGGVERLACATRTAEGFHFSLAADRPAATRPALGKRGPRGGPSVVALLADLASRHERVELPPMKPAQVRRAMEFRMEAAAAKNEGAEGSYAPCRPEKPNDLLVVTASREAVAGLLRDLRDAGYRVERVVTPAAALAGMVQAIRPAREEEQATALVHFGEDVGSVAFLLGGALVLAREFRMPKPAAGWVEEAVAGSLPRLDPSFRDHLIGEIGRSLLFFNTRFRGKPVARVLLSSDLDGVEEMLPACAEKFGEGTELLVDWIGIDASGFDEDEAEGRRKTILWLGAFAAATVGLTGIPDIDLTPAAQVRERGRARAMRLAATAFLSLAAVMTLDHISHLDRSRRFSGAQETLARHVAGADERIVRSHDTAEARARAAEQLALLESARSPVRAFRGALQAVSLASTDSLVIEHLSLGHPDDDAGSFSMNESGALRLRLAGSVSVSSGAEAQRQLDVFLASLREDCLFREAKAPSLRMEAREGVGGSVLRFEMEVPVDRQGGSS